MRFELLKEMDKWTHRYSDMKGGECMRLEKINIMI